MKIFFAIACVTLTGAAITLATGNEDGHCDLDGSDDSPAWLSGGYEANPYSNSSHLSFHGSGHIHIDEKNPWNNCDICGLHKVYW